MNLDTFTKSYSPGKTLNKCEINFTFISGPLEIWLTVKNICHEYHCIVMMLTRRIFTPSDAFLPYASQSVIKTVIKLCYA
jgi:hypothetical protein